MLASCIAGTCFRLSCGARLAEVQAQTDCGLPVTLNDLRITTRAMGSGKQRSRTYFVGTEPQGRLEARQGTLKPAHLGALRSQGKRYESFAPSMEPLGETIPTETEISRSSIRNHTAWQRISFEAGASSTAICVNFGGARIGHETMVCKRCN